MGKPVRTGKLFALHAREHSVPEMVIVGKALSGSFFYFRRYCLRAVCWACSRPGDHGDHLRKKPVRLRCRWHGVTCLLEKKMGKNSAELGAYFLQELRKLRSPLIKEIEGKGLCVRYRTDRRTRPSCERLKDLGVLKRKRVRR